MLDPKEILLKLDMLSIIDSNRMVFGAAFHDYHLNPPLDEAAFGWIETKYSILLPDDYRTFILEVGNGGAGPFYGLFKLGEHDSGDGFCSWSDGYLLGDPSAPFPYNDRWNLSEAFWSEAPYNQQWGNQDEEDRACEAWDERLYELYWAPSIMNGAIPICHRGCALRQWMIVTGPERGNIWNDDRADNGGLSPLISPCGDRISFFDWYYDWLNQSISAAEEEEQSSSQSAP
ncbi:MAG: hypothetical protein PVI78_08960 [Anaerolineales bacterium]|jgi:hypothetical protein